MRILFSIACFFSTLFLYAQDVQISASVNTNNTSVGDYIQYTIEANQQGNFTIPEFEGFKTIRGGGTSTNSSISFINGKMTQSYTFSTSYILQPTKKGTFTIPPAKITVNGKTYQSNSVSINVSEGSNIEVKDDSELFARIELNKTKAYVGEPVVATYIVYSKARPDGYEISNTIASQGFWTDELSNEHKLYNKRINNINYYVLELRTVLMMPQKTGMLTINPFEANIRLMGRRNYYGFSVPEPKIEQIKSSSTSITVLPLPKEATSGFVGNFELYAELSKTETAVDEGFDLKLKIEGTGNLNRINELNLKLPSDLEAYEPEITEKTSVTYDGYKGSKSFQYFIVPRAAGEYTIPEITIDYFDTKSKSVKTISTPPFTIKVNKSSNQTNITTQNFGHGANQSGVSILDDDIRFIKTSTVLEKNNDWIVKKWWFWLLASMPLVAYLSTVILPKIANLSDHSIAKKAKLKKLLKEADNVLKNGNESEGYNLLSKAWQTLLLEYYNISLSEWTLRNIQEKLINKNIDEILIKEIIGNINDIEEAKYSPVRIKSSREVFDKCVLLINKIENEK